MCEVSLYVAPRLCVWGSQCVVATSLQLPCFTIVDKFAAEGVISASSSCDVVSIHPVALSCPESLRGSNLDFTSVVSSTS